MYARISHTVLMFTTCFYLFMFCTIFYLYGLLSEINYYYYYYCCCYYYVLAKTVLLNESMKMSCLFYDLCIKLNCILIC